MTQIKTAEYIWLDGNIPVSDLGNPQHSTSKNFTLRTDYEAPVVQCGFKEESESINILDGKTLYHYVTTYNQASDGMKLDDAGFFYNVTVSPPASHHQIFPSVCNCSLT